MKINEKEVNFYLTNVKELFICCIHTSIQLHRNSIDILFLYYHSLAEETLSIY